MGVFSPFPPDVLLHLFICSYVGGHSHATHSKCVEVREPLLGVGSLDFYHVDPGNEARVFRLGGKFPTHRGISLDLRLSL